MAAEGLRPLATNGWSLGTGLTLLLKLEPNGTMVCPRSSPTGRATSVPFTVVQRGPERTTTDNAKAPLTCAALPSQVRSPADLALGARVAGPI